IRSAEAVLEMTLKYVKERQAFGKSIGKFQHIRFKLADMATEQAAARAFADQVLISHANGSKAMVQASQLKLHCSELLKRHVDACLQFYGGYGFMNEYPIARAYVDARVQTIYAGTSEIMREIISSSGLGL
ncbi:MAG: acyl-CoA dehydrogenase, partial [Leptospiraceae bacterium]|nr:acyl-CoA dehydrogenase [Leptospiraceae bacterium]